jgi:hypothetical protein
MKIIKHLVNIMFLYSIPFILLGFFCLITAFSFKYTDAVVSSVWISVVGIYCVIATLMYAVCAEEEDAMMIWK